MKCEHCQREYDEPVSSIINYSQEEDGGIYHTVYHTCPHCMRVQKVWKKKGFHPIKGDDGR